MIDGWPSMNHDDCRPVLPPQSMLKTISPRLMHGQPVTPSGQPLPPPTFVDVYQRFPPRDCLNRCLYPDDLVALWKALNWGLDDEVERYFRLWDSTTMSLVSSTRAISPPDITPPPYYHGEDFIHTLPSAVHEWLNAPKARVSQMQVEGVAPHLQISFTIQDIGTGSMIGPVLPSRNPCLRVLVKIDHSRRQDVMAKTWSTMEQKARRRAVREVLHELRLTVRALFECPLRDHVDRLRETGEMDSESGHRFEH